jgi:hypothetical protein
MGRKLTPLRISCWQTASPAGVRRPDGRIAAMVTNPRQARKDLLVKGLILSFLGLVVLLSPLFIHSAGFAQAVGGSSVVGWFALVLGIAFLAQWALRRNRP